MATRILHITQSEATIVADLTDGRELFATIFPNDQGPGHMVSFEPYDAYVKLSFEDRKAVEHHIALAIEMGLDGHISTHIWEPGEDTNQTLTQWEQANQGFEYFGSKVEDCPNDDDLLTPEMASAFI